MTKLKLTATLFLGLLMANPAFASIGVDKMVLEMDTAANTRQNVFVSNNGDKTAYVATDVFEIKNPGDENEERVPVNLKDKNRLIVAPNKLVIEPQDKKRIQFNTTDTNLEKDKIYRISVAPKISGIETDEGVNIKILIGYDILAIVRPAKPVFDLKVDKKGGHITFKNNGNTNVLLASVKQCPQKDKCEMLLSRRLYAGNKAEIKLIDITKPVIAEIHYGDEIKTETY
ncbi:MAG: hypothetical protein LBU87_04125 [Lactobacillales bacterium]|jgi:P pilus assembly chaperone PapD|nr:hypothetical protein [Lactobacillales bacterium]